MTAQSEPSPLAKRLGGLLQQQRLRHGLTQSEVAERSDLSLKYLGEVERGEANVTVSALERIASALEWDPWELFNHDPTPISKKVHELLVAELKNGHERTGTLIAWLEALDPALREAVPTSFNRSSLDQLRRSKRQAIATRRAQTKRGGKR